MLIHINILILLIAIFKNLTFYGFIKYGSLNTSIHFCTLRVYPKTCLSVF